MHRNKKTITFALLSLVAMAYAPLVSATEADDLAQLLDDFLAGVTQAETHDRFWADDLIYTSSRGTRSTKSDIMSGFVVPDDGATPAPGPVFSAKDIQIHVYGQAAVVAFKLVATPPPGSEEMGVQNYFNTGTFLKRDGIWQAVAWQATIIPMQNE